MVCDRKNPKLVTFVGAILISAGFALMGPLPFFNLKKTIPIVIAGLTLHGLGNSKQIADSFCLYYCLQLLSLFIIYLGLGAEVVAGFADAHKSAIASGFPDTIDTYGLVSGM